ncbi:MAG: GIY-YIG nuclease family protein [Candidatus Marinimicrobia bacterium]|nr:GIY-YIG nuclease family protein [Candidatus Neomarinimicrobiota bacterium]MBL7067754.1 GIY-YIG nuclease family protein [Candidatus Neomarinimicrobiota bacterium]
MDFYVYIIYSKSRDKYYIGYTHDLNLRLVHHNDGWTRSTKSGIPWKLVYSEKFESRSQAMKREKEIKCMKSRKYIESLINKK